MFSDYENVVGSPSNKITAYDSIARLKPHVTSWWEISGVGTAAASATASIRKSRPSSTLATAAIASKKRGVEFKVCVRNETKSKKSRRKRLTLVSAMAWSV